MKNMLLEPRLLFFTGSARVTAEDQVTAESISTNVGYRNGSLNPGDRIEPCDAAAGPSIPDLYKKTVPIVTSRTELAAAMKAKAEAAARNPGPAEIRMKPAKAWGSITAAPPKQPAEIEYMLDEDGEPVVIDGQMLVIGSPEQIAYQASLASVAGDDTQAGAEGAQAGAESPAAAPAAASAPELAPAPPKAKRGPKPKPKPDNAPKKPAAAPGWGRNP